MPIASTDLTVTQSLIWTSQQLSPQSPMFNGGVTFEFSEPLDPERLERAWKAVVDGSDALRTVFIEQGGMVEQRILDRVGASLPVHDFCGEGQPEEAARRWVDERISRPLDLANCIFDAALLRLPEDRWIWYLNVHHLVFDAWSIGVICQQTSRFYQSLGDGEPPEPLPQFIDYRTHEQQCRQSKKFRDTRDHWKQCENAPVGLVTLYGRKSKRGASDSVRISVPFGLQRSVRLREMGELTDWRGFSPHLTRYNLLSTIVFAYLYRISGSQLLTIGSPAANRHTPAFRNTVGLFIETLPFSVSLEDSDTFRALFKKVSKESMSFLRYAQPGCSTMALSRTFNVVMNYISAALGEFDGKPVKTELLHPGQLDSGHELRFHLHDLSDTGEIIAQMDVNTSTLEENARDSMGGHFLRMADAFIQNPDALIGSVALLGEDEGRSQLVDFNPTMQGLEDSSVLEAFSASVASAPQASAAQYQDQSITYAELDTRSDRLAAELVRRGVSKEENVGIFLRRSLDFLIAVLGVLKAGGAFVPLECRLPAERLAFMVEDAGIKCIVSDDALADGASGTGADTVLISEEGQWPAANTELPAVDPLQAAYVIYTSGSTGRPKGVVVDHAALAAYAQWALDTYANGGPVRFAFHSSVGFDLTITSIFVPLVAGGSVIVYPEDGSLHDLSILRVFEADEADIVKLTPAHLALVLEQAKPTSRIRRLILGGENLETELAGRARTVLGEVEIYNEYGPTEAVVGCMVHRFDQEADKGVSVPIGVPAAHHRVYLLDKGLNPVPEGVPAELFVAGEYLASGYLNRPEETAGRFIADPHVPGKRMYRTGDLARFQRPGVLEYLGRADDQVKVGGVRIEPAEVQQQVIAFPGIQDCVVDAIELADFREEADVHFCERCGLSSEYPDISFNAQSVCNLCTDFDSYRKKADVYFGDMEELREKMKRAKERRTGQYDCLMLVSGGKDSTYALYRLAELGPDILAVTLDNGYISDGAKANIRRVAAEKGITHRFVSTPVMKEVFKDSLERHSNVCQGCFKVIYTLSMQLALDEGIPCIVTGLSRGQFFETRLTPELFQGSEVSCEGIEQTVLDARKAYHGVDDAVSRLMDTAMLEDDRVFEEVEFVDFYRYCDVGLDEVYRFLKVHATWNRPKDTGRSTNCTINDTGIYVHKHKEGFHNYALPYSWDVRMGHKTRDEALEELNDEIDVVRVHEILQEIGYDEDAFSHEPSGKRLVAYYTADTEIDEAALREHLARGLPSGMIPSFFVAVQQIPLTSNGKIDRAALPAPHVGRPQVDSVYLEPRTPLEDKLAGIWKGVLDIHRVGVVDNFYALGGDSISAIQIAARAMAAGLQLKATDVFEHQTVESLAEYVATRSPAEPVQEEKSDAPERFSLAGLDADKLSKVERLLGRKD